MLGSHDGCRGGSLSRTLDLVCIPEDSASPVEERQSFGMDRGFLKTTLQYGTVTALQQSCQPVGKLLIQGSVNTLGVNTIAAFNGGKPGR